MRRARITSENGGFYHVISRIIERRRILGDHEKEVFRSIMRQVAGFCGVKVLTWSAMSSHWHILLYVPPREPVSDAIFVERLGFLYKPVDVKEVAGKLAEYRENGLVASAELLKEQYTYRMYDLGEFCKTLKQRFSQYYNRHNGRSGPLWEQRYKSILIEGDGRAIQAVGAYIDLNAVRAGQVSDPKDYRFCGYAEAVGGSPQARSGIESIVDWFGTAKSWSEAAAQYRSYLFIRGETGEDEQGRLLRPGFSAERVAEVLKSGGKLPLQDALRCRVKYFTDGVALGSAEFVEAVFLKHRGLFGQKRTAGARPMSDADWGGLCTLRNYRLAPTG